MATPIEIVIASVLSGGCGSAIGALASWRVKSRQVKIEETKTPALMENILLEGAEKAVVSLGFALDRHEKKIQSLEKDVERLERDVERERARNLVKDERIGELESLLSEAKQTLAGALRDLAEFRDQARELRSQDPL